jgi:nitrogen fixation NifU-like protein
VEAGRVARVRFDAKGCAISTASASVMTTVIEGRPLEDARVFARSFIRAVRGEGAAEFLEASPELGAFGGLARFPVRVKCATLPWHALLLTLAHVHARRVIYCRVTVAPVVVPPPTVASPFPPLDAATLAYRY